MWRRAPLPLALLLPAAFLSACAAGSSDGDGEVVASFYPLQYVAERVVGDEATVTNLTPVGVEPHDLELSPRQVSSLTGAQVVFYERGLQPAVDEAVANDPAERVVDAAEVVDLVDDDPHFWLDPTLLAEAGDSFTREMAAADPDHAADYEARNQRLQADLRALDEEFRAGLDDCRTRTVVVSHDAFGYLGQRYDLDVRPIAGLSPDAEPSARHLAELAEVIRSDDVTTVFSERLASPRMANTLADDLGVQTGVLDPLEGLDSENSDADYLSVMRENLAALTSAGGCS